MLFSDVLLGVMEVLETGHLGGIWEGGQFRWWRPPKSGGCDLEVEHDIFMSASESFRQEAVLVL